MVDQEREERSGKRVLTVMTQSVRPRVYSVILKGIGVY